MNKRITSILLCFIHGKRIGERDGHFRLKRGIHRKAHHIENKQKKGNQQCCGTEKCREQHQGRTRQFPQPVQCRLVNRRDSHWHSINRWHRIIHRRYVWRRVGRRGRRCLRLNRGRCLRLQDKSAMGTINRLIVIRLSTSWTIRDHPKFCVNLLRGVE